MSRKLFITPGTVELWKMVYLIGVFEDPMTYDCEVLGIREAGVWRPGSSRDFRISFDVKKESSFHSSLLHLYMRPLVI